MISPQSRHVAVTWAPLFDVILKYFVNSMVCDGAFNVASSGFWVPFSVGFLFVWIREWYFSCKSPWVFWRKEWIILFNLLLKGQFIAQKQKKCKINFYIFLLLKNLYNSYIWTAIKYAYLFYTCYSGAWGDTRIVKAICASVYTKSQKMTMFYIIVKKSCLPSTILHQEHF